MVTSVVQDKDLDGQVQADDGLQFQGAERYVLIIFAYLHHQDPTGGALSLSLSLSLSG
jgi:hypothetical protein